jgi:hypothetical protein
MNIMDIKMIEWYRNECNLIQKWNEPLLPIKILFKKTMITIVAEVIVEEIRDDSANEYEYATNQNNKIVYNITNECELLSIENDNIILVHESEFISNVNDTIIQPYITVKENVSRTFKDDHIFGSVTNVIIDQIENTVNDYVYFTNNNDQISNECELLSIENENMILVHESQFISNVNDNIIQPYITVNENVSRTFKDDHIFGSVTNVIIDQIVNDNNNNDKIFNECELLSNENVILVHESEFISNVNDNIIQTYISVEGNVCTTIKDDNIFESVTNDIIDQIENTVNDYVYFNDKNFNECESVSNEYDQQIENKIILKEDRSIMNISDNIISVKEYGSVSNENDNLIKIKIPTHEFEYVVNEQDLIESKTIAKQSESVINENGIIQMKPQKESEVEITVNESKFVTPINNYQLDRKISKESVSKIINEYDNLKLSKKYHTAKKIIYNLKLKDENNTTEIKRMTEYMIQLTQKNLELERFTKMIQLEYETAKKTYNKALKDYDYQLKTVEKELIKSKGFFSF